MKIGSWAVELLAYLVKGIFIMIGKLRLKAIRNGITIKPNKLSAETGDSPSPQLKLKIELATKTDGKVNTDYLMIKLGCGNWEVYRSVFNTSDGLPQCIGRRKDESITLIINPPYHFWIVAPDKLEVKGELFISSIWGSTTKEIETTVLEITDIKEVAQEFLSGLEQKFAKLTRGGGV
jgi:hypothetical protein